MEIATRNGVIPGRMGLAQAHPLAKPPAMGEQPSNGLGPVSYGLPYPFGRWSSETSNFRSAPYKRMHHGEGTPRNGGRNTLDTCNTVGVPR